MKFSFKKVVPVITGALLLGSTVGFAAGVAGQSSTFPNSFSDAVVVVGANSDDSAAANQIAAELGKLATTGAATVTEGHLVRKGSSVLNYGEDWQDIDSKLDDSDLPKLLADGRYRDTKGTNANDEDYTQELEFVNGGNKFVFEADDNRNDKAGAYLRLTDGTVAYNYTLDFTTGPKYDNSTAANLDADFENTEITLLGDKWVIIDAQASNLANGPNKLTLLGGAVFKTVKDGQTIDVDVGGKTREVTVSVFSSQVNILIDGKSLTIDEGATDELDDGTEIGVSDILVRGDVAAQADIYFGARKLVLEDGQEVELNGDDVDGSLVRIHNDVSNKRLDIMHISYTPEDDAWLAEGEQWDDPIFGKFKFVFAGVKKAGEETITVRTSTDTGSLKVKTRGGKDVTIDFYDNDTDVFLGSKFTRANVSVNGRRVLTSQADNGGDLLVADNDFCWATDIERCEGIELLVVDGQGEARIYELKDINVRDSLITFRDKMSGKDYEKPYSNGSNTIDIGLISDLGVFINFTANATPADGVDYSATVSTGFLNFTNLNSYGPISGGFETSLEGALNLAHAGKNVRVKLYNDTSGEIKEWNISLDSDQDMIVSISGLLDEVSGSDQQVGIDGSNYGAWFSYESEDKRELTVTYPGDEPAWADMYVSPIGAAVVGGAASAPVRDTEVGTLKTSKNLVVVGGPAVNRLAAELLGLDFPTYGSQTDLFSEDSAMIREFAKAFGGEKVALLVAGYESKDTASAAKALVTDKKYGDLTTTTASTYSYA